MNRKEKIMICQEVGIDNGNNPYAVHFPGEGIPGGIDNIESVGEGGGEPHRSGAETLEDDEVLNKGSGC